MERNTISRWSKLLQSLPLALGLLLVAAVWVSGAVWSFSEQRDFATNLGFDLPLLLPLTIDGLALSLAVVAWSAALDGRAAVQARIGTFLAIAASATSNATWAVSRSSGDVVTVVIAGGIPLAAAVAFETLLAELRKGVHRRRGEEPPVVIAAPRLIRLVLSPWSTFISWRRNVLVLTDPRRSTSRAKPVEASKAAEAPGGAPSRPAVGQKAVAPRRPASDAGDLLLAAQAVAADLERAGQKLTRRSLVEGLRGRGRGCGTDKANELLRQLTAA